jgi:enoyl-CoA hydratase/carnithine racemase
MTDAILVERAGAVATVVLNRPEKLNALTKAMWRSLGEAIDALSADDALRCVIVRGAGEKAFSPGNDLPVVKAAMRKMRNIPLPTSPGPTSNGNDPRVRRPPKVNSSRSSGMSEALVIMRAARVTPYHLRSVSRIF